MALGTSVNGSGGNAIGWTESGWVGGANSHFHTVDPLPDLNYQISGGVILNGGDRAIQLRTAPEPAPANLRISRSFPPQNATVYFSLLFRIESIGTGSDTINFQFASGSTVYGGYRFEVDQSATFMTIFPYQPGVSSSGTARKVYSGTTQLFVGRFSRTSSTSFLMGYWLNPTNTYSSPSNLEYGGSIASSATFSTLGFEVISTDTGGPSTSITIDEIRVGYLWADVVPPAPVELVPQVTISPAIKLRWQSQTGKTYQPQYSYDLATWFDLGSTVTGNGQLKELFDASETDSKKFYQIQIR